MTKTMEWTSVVIACLGMAMVASSCASVPKKPPCITECGMLLEDEGNGSLSCDTIQEAEDRMLAAGDELKGVDPRLESRHACQQLFGWQVKLPTAVIMIDDSVVGGVPFVGLAECDRKVVWLMANQSWRKGSFPHEYFHMVQECNPPSDWSGVDENRFVGQGHRGWHNKGVSDIIDDFRSGRR